VTAILEHATIKVLTGVGYDLLQNSVTTDNVLPEKILYSCRGHVSDRLCFYPLGEIFHRYYDKSVVSLCGCEFANDIDAPPLQWPRWNDQLRGLGGRLRSVREFLASFTSCHQFGCIINHCWPVETLLQDLSY
jgi:hypothetical protein